MRSRLAILLVLVFAGVVISGCVGSAGMMNQGFASVTELGDPDHSARKVDHVENSYSCSYIFGIALDDPDLWENTMKGLRDKAGLQGKARAFSNMSSDRTTWSILGVYKKEQLTLTADVVEFTN